MVVPTINMVTTTATVSAPTAFGPTDAGNSEVNTTTKLDFGTLNIDANAWSVVKPVWAYVTNMQGNTSIANMGFYVDGSLVAGMTHYDKITATWENPAATGNAQQTGSSASATSSTSKHTVNKSDGSSTMTAVGDHSQYIFCQWYVLSSVATGQKTTGAGTGRPTFAFTYS
jgi:hypothetical protein